MLPPMNAKVATPKQTPPKTLSVAPIETLAPSEPVPSTSTSISPPPVVSVIQSSSSNECEVATPAQPTSSPQKTPVKNSPSSPQSLKESNNKVKKVPFQMLPRNICSYLETVDIYISLSALCNEILVHDSMLFFCC